MAGYDGPTRYDSNEDQKRKMFVGGLPSSTGEDELRQHFEQFGDLTDVVVMRDKATGRSRGFGFITFKDPEGVDRVQSSRPHLLDNKEVETKRAMPRGDANRDDSQLRVDKLFVGGLKSDTTDGELRDYFSAYGTVMSVEVATDRETGNPRGFAFVTFSDSDSVDKAILYKPHNIGDSVRVDCKKALSREQMAEMKARQSQMPMGGGYMGGRGGGGGGYMGGRGGGGYGNGGGGGYGNGGGYGRGRGGYGRGGDFNGGGGGGRGGYRGGGYGYDDAPRNGGGYNDGYAGGSADPGGYGDMGYDNGNGGFGSYDGQGYGGGPSKGSAPMGGGPSRYQPYNGSSSRGGMGSRGGSRGGGYRGGRGRPEPY